MDRYLFVITRDLQTDPSALHLIRQAGACARRKSQVTVVLAESALCCDTVKECEALLARLQAAGVELLLHADLQRTLGKGGAGLCLDQATDAVLAELLLTTGIRAHWC